MIYASQSQQITQYGSSIGSTLFGNDRRTLPPPFSKTTAESHYVQQQVYSSSPSARMQPIGHGQSGLPAVSMTNYLPMGYRQQEEYDQQQSELIYGGMSQVNPPYPPTSANRGGFRANSGFPNGGRLSDSDAAQQFALPEQEFQRPGNPHRRTQAGSAHTMRSDENGGSPHRHRTHVPTSKRPADHDGEIPGRMTHRRRRSNASVSYPPTELPGSQISGATTYKGVRSLQPKPTPAVSKRAELQQDNVSWGPRLVRKLPERTGAAPGEFCLRFA